MNNDNKVETAIAGLNCWASYATACKKRLFTSFVALVSFENLYKLLLQKVGMFRIKIDKTCIKT